MPANLLTNKYYKFLAKFYNMIDNNNIKWVKARNANYYTVDINNKFNIRISKTVANVASNYFFKMFDDNGVRIIEITSEVNGQDIIDIDGKKMKIHDILEEIHDWSQAFTQDTIEKIDTATEMLDSLGKNLF